MKERQRMLKESTSASSSLAGGYTFDGSLLLSSSSVNDLLYVLQQWETNLEMVQKMPSESMKLAIQPAISTLISTKLIMHPDTQVNIAVACCMCEIFRIMAYATPYSDEQMKDFFQLIVITFERLSSGYAKMVKVLETLDIGKLSVMMCDLQLDGLIVRLFKQFLTVADSNSAAVVINMKQIMVMIIEKTESVNYMLVDLLVKSVRKENKISLPVCWQLGRDVLMMCVAQLKPHLPEKVAEEVYSPLKEKYATRKRKLKCLDGSSNMVQPLRRCPSVRERKKKSLLTEDPPMPNKSATKVQSVEHGENLVGRRIKVWSSSNKIYGQGVVKSFDCENKTHKVLYDDGEEALLDLKQGRWELVKMASKLSKFDSELINAGKGILNLPSSTAELLSVLKQMEKLLESVQLPKGKGKHMLSESTKYAMHPIIEALTAKELLRHPDMDVNISVACCICDVLRTMEGNAVCTNAQMKDFFELAVTTFEKLSTASDGCYTRLFKVLKTLSGLSFSVLESDLRSNQLIVRLFKQFLTVADSNSFDVVLEMKKIVTIIIKESESLNRELVDLLVTSVRKENQITSPVCWKLGNEVLEKCAAKLKPHLQDKVAENEGNSLRKIIESATNTSKLTTNEIQQMQTRLQRLRHSKDATRHTVNVHSEVEKKTLSSADPSMPSTSVIEVSSDDDDDDDDKERIFRTGTQGKLLKNVSAAPDSLRQATPSGDMISVQGYSVKQSIAPILEAIFKKHGDILVDCIFKIASVRTCLLEVVCEVARQIETSDVTTIMSKMEEIESKVKQAEAANINVSWLRDQLKIIHTRNESLKKTASLKDIKINTVLAKRAAQADLGERHRELVVAQEQFAKAERCVQVLNLVEAKLIMDIIGIES